MGEEYSKDEADRLIAYYSPLIIGKILDESTRAIAQTIVMRNAGKSKFEVRAEGMFRGNTLLSKSVGKVASLHSLKNPKEVLSSLNQQ
jgi:hypothetical protein